MGTPTQFESSIPAETGSPAVAPTPTEAMPFPTTAACVVVAQRRRRMADAPTPWMRRVAAWIVVGLAFGFMVGSPSVHRELLKLGAGCGVESDLAVLAFPGFKHAVVQQRAQLPPDGSAFAHAARRRRTLTPPFALL